MLGLYMISLVIHVLSFKDCVVIIPVICVCAIDNFFTFASPSPQRTPLIFIYRHCVFALCVVYEDRDRQAFIVRPTESSNFLSSRDYISALSQTSDALRRAVLRAQSLPSTTSLRRRIRWYCAGGDARPKINHPSSLRPQPQTSPSISSRDGLVTDFLVTRFT